MAEFFATEVDDDVQAVLESGGYFTQGFQGGTLGDYREWYRGAFGMDPFQTAANISGQRLVPTGVDDPVQWLSRNPLNFSPEAGFTGPDPTSPRQVFAVQRASEQHAQAQERDARQRGLAQLNWLMGLSTQLSGTDFQSIAPIAMAGAQVQTQFQAPVTDFSGLLGIMSQEQMQRQQQEASQFSFTRDLLPSLLTIGGAIAGGPGGAAAGAAAGRAVSR
jgi:hypothetical protein